MSSRSNLESLLNSLPPQQQYQRPKAKEPSFEQDYARMRQLAEEKDDFKQVLEVYVSVLRRSPLARERATTVLREAFAQYGQTQLLLAQTCATLGRFEEADACIKNACGGYSVKIDYYSSISLESSITEEEIASIISKAIKKTSSAYFLQKAMQVADAGDINEAEKYCGLTLTALREKGTSLFCSEIGIVLDKYAAYKINKTVEGLHKKAFRVAFQREVETAVGYAVSDSFFATQDLTTAREKVRELVVKYWELFVPFKKGETSDIAAFLNERIHPLFEELHEVTRDKQHPLRKMYKPRRKETYSSSVIGCERIATSEALVPRRFYEEAYRQTKIPIVVHSFFASVAERYGTV